MKKRIIFDLDNTLIMWQDKYKNAIKKTIEFYKLDVNYLEVDNIIESYEYKYDRYDKYMLLDLINKIFNLNLTIDFIDKWLYELGFMADISEESIDTLKYLFQKYELVVLTNWFKSSQIERLKTANIYKYFKEIYGGDEFMKPSKESYYKALGNRKIEECIMIGDNIPIDLEGAQKIGLDTILISKVKQNKYKQIEELKELKNIL